MIDATAVVGVLDRVTAVLEAFDSDDRGLRISDLSARTGLPTSTVSRVVAGLVQHHYLERDGALLRLGLRLFELGQLAVDPRRLRALAGPPLVALRQQTGGNVQLAVRDGDDAVVLLLLRGRSPSPGLGPVGDRRPLDQSPCGRAMLGCEPAHTAPAGTEPGGRHIAALPVAVGGHDAMMAVCLAGVRDDLALRTSVDLIERAWRASRG